ncbi:MAG: hypothetical protein BEU05_03000 [Marine Group III euryarchaeote CG-Bathy2]|uniref:Hef nuclease (FANCM) n=3 Tax=Methanobacteriati TaxID=3366610 RepID=A0A075HFV2_9EURY|nr:Hef nuclease (FANCM) [uncultured marine group II/III euryarchaeote KM3_200_A03]AIF14030.1 Hef nuclease (FANCM) [uncultured marine group II/III euryarchaeote KM3_65_G10]OIR12568.1 MAG: hypothetical protein BEU05_03000 [Marine Group III euryarchaeote CG-Bathy2]
MKSLAHPLLQGPPLEERAYQRNVAAACLRESTLAVLPTGLGKTVIALQVMLERLEMGRVLMMAPTRPLAEQHAGFLSRSLDMRIELLTGSVSPAKREPLWQAAQVVVATPQVVEKDLIRGAAKLADFALAVFDEAHRAVGNYAYVFIAERYAETALQPLVLGMTASPGSTRAAVVEVCVNLRITAIEKRDDADPDVAPYIQPVQTRWVKVPLPASAARIRRDLQKLQDRLCGQLHQAGLLTRPRKVSTTMLLDAGKKLQARLRAAGKQAPRQVYNLLSVQAMALKVAHALLTVETQGPTQFLDYAARMRRDSKSRATKWLLQKPEWKQAVIDAARSSDEHPKLERLDELVAQELAAGAERIIVFAEIRNTASLMVERLAKLPGARPVRFVGQGSRKGDPGMTQKVQKATLEQFRAGDYNVLVATSVGEEGLDIPATEVVIFYEPVPSAIRLIQRRGRTGRDRPGKVYVLITADTRDEAAYWSSRSKEMQMQSLFGGGRMEIELPSRAELGGGSPGGDAPPVARGQTRLGDAPRATPQGDNPAAVPAAEEVRLQVDHREFPSGVARELAQRGVTVAPTQLPVGDYLIDGRVGVERKTGADFVGSMLDGSLFRQLKALKQQFRRPLLILEGDDLYTARRVEPKAIRGALAAIAGDFGVPILPSADTAETADLLVALLERSRRTPGPPQLRPAAGKLSPEEQQRHILEGLPGISAVLAQRLLHHFRSVAAVFAADTEALREVEGIGALKAAAVRDAIERVWEP